MFRLNLARVRIDLQALGKSLNESTAALYTRPEPVQNGDSGFPVDASVCHGLTVLQSSGTGCGNVLTTLDEVALNHYTHDAGRCGFVGFELFSLYQRPGVEFHFYCDKKCRQPLTMLLATSTCFWCCFELFP